MSFKSSSSFKAQAGALSEKSKKESKTEEVLWQYGEFY